MTNWRSAFAPIATAQLERQNSQELWIRDSIRIEKSGALFSA